MSLERAEITGRNYRVLVGDVRDRLREIPSGYFHCVVTSPPYFGLRDYQTATWEGGDATCDHQSVIRAAATAAVGTNGDANKIEQQIAGKLGLWKSCPACGAIPKDDQIGLEETPAIFIAALVDVFAEVWRVLRDDGTLWVNMGDSYAAQRGGTHMPAQTVAGGVSGDGTDEAFRGTGGTDRKCAHRNAAAIGFKHKDRMMIPHRLAIAMQDWGWTVRDEIVWAKRSPMPESVTDRTTKSHEFIFLLTKRPRYFYDNVAVKEPLAESSYGRQQRFENAMESMGTPERADSKHRINGVDQTMGFAGLASGRSKGCDLETGLRNLRSVWLLSTEPTTSNHFASFPSELPARCIKAGTSEKGCCVACGTPWRRIVEKSNKPDMSAKGSSFDKGKTVSRDGGDRTQTGERYVNMTTGWAAGCDCKAEIVPCRVCDPFSGTGTTGMVATELGREYTGIELNAEYAADSQRRIESWKHRGVDKQAAPMSGQRTMFDEDTP